MSLVVGLVMIYRDVEVGRIELFFLISSKRAHNVYPDVGKNLKVQRAESRSNVFLVGPGERGVV